MNVLMAGMAPTMLLAMKFVHGAHDPAGPAFWFVMSMALLVGFVTAYPMNWWLVSRHLKHGMMTVRSSEADKPQQGHEDGYANHNGNHVMDHHDAVETRSMEHDRGGNVSKGALAGMTVLSIVLFALGIGIAAFFGGFS